MLSYLPLAHVAERTLVEHGLLAIALHVFFAESLETFVADLQRARPTLFFSVPRLWVKFQQGVHAKMPPEKLQRLLKHSDPARHRAQEDPAVRSASTRASSRPAAPRRCRPNCCSGTPTLGLPIVEVYGMTENCGVSHATLRGVRAARARSARRTTASRAGSTR